MNFCENHHLIMVWCKVGLVLAGSTCSNSR